jgi:hypothetical protein
MKTLLLSTLTAILLLATFPVMADDLPMLPSSQPSQLPSLDTVTIQAVQDQNLSVTCYLGNPNDKNSLGDIMVHTAPEAGSICNSMYFACKGSCFGCFSDFDLSQDICVDNSGKKFLR